MGTSVANRGIIKGPAILGDDDYMPLERLSMALTRGTSHDEGAFTICFWIYLLKTTTSGVIIRQGRPHAHAALPFLTMDSDRKLTLHPLPPPLNAIPSADPLKGAMSKATVTSEQSVHIEKWVHIGCEVGPDVARLHMDSVVVGHKPVSFSTNGGVGGDAGVVLLSGGDGSNTGGGVQAYAHYVRVIPRPTVTNHYVKNPPLELQLDGTGGSDDNELEEGHDGVWSVVGGKASCRRNFALDVVLLDALGRSAQREMEVVASLVYADDGSPVQKLRDDAEAPLLTTFDGVEFPSTERPVKLVHGRASFKLKISQLSSKCDNRLFRVCFDPLHTPKYPFLRALSRPIRCVSRNRNHRSGASGTKRLAGTAFGSDNSPGHDEDAAGTPTTGNDSRGHDFMLAPMMVPNSPSAVHLSKRPRLGGEENSYPAASRTERSPDQIAAPCDGGGGGTTHSGSTLPQHAAAAASHQQAHLAASLLAGLGKVDGAYPNYVDPTMAAAAMAAAGMLSARQMGGFPGALGATAGMGLTQHEATGLFAQAMADAARAQQNGMGSGAFGEGGFSDDLVFKYCLESMCCRAEFLKAAIMHKSDQDIANFATRVAQCTGCRHNGYQIAIAKRLLKDGDDVWEKASSTRFPVSWGVLIKLVEACFFRLVETQKRPFALKDVEFLRRVAGCSDVVSREEFDRLWHWIYPIALNLSIPQLRSSWESEDPKWIQGFLSREEAEAVLTSPSGCPLKPGTFIIRFASSRLWPHPDAGALVVSYVGTGAEDPFCHKLLSVDESPGTLTEDVLESGRSLSELLLAQPELTEIYKSDVDAQALENSGSGGSNTKSCHAEREGLVEIKSIPVVNDGPNGVVS